MVLSPSQNQNYPLDKTGGMNHCFQVAGGNKSRLKRDKVKVKDK